MKAIFHAGLDASLSGFLWRCNATTVPASSRRWGSFNPYRVFSGSATAPSGVAKLPRDCFNPYRVFSGSATWRGRLIGCNLKTKFQSLSGFLGLCNFGMVVGFYFAGQFQSLSGFLGLCNIPAGGTGEITSTKFQSLSGFLGLCNTSRARAVSLVDSVSIPIGFSRALQRSPSRLSERRLPRFNPYRVFSGSAT